MEIKNLEELFIFNRMVEGDKEAFRFFFDKYYSDLCNLVNIYLHNQVISEEIVQDVYIYFWERKGKIKIESSVKSYLLKASKHKSLNYLRNEKNKLNILEKLSKVTNSSPDIPDNIMDASQIREVIEKSVNSLPERCRQVYVLSKEKNLSYKEIANELGISVKTVENQMVKALKKLRELLRPYYNDIFIFFLLVISC
jgi:RNA polymerase sigma-70 factor (ECF subfamily)